MPGDWTPEPFEADDGTVPFQRFIEHGFTQAELAERCGIDQGDISRIERGSTSPTARTLQRIAEALDADVRLVGRASLRQLASRYSLCRCPAREGIQRRSCASGGQ